MSYEQLQLFEIPVQQSPQTVHDPYWDELELQPQKACDNFDQDIFTDETQASTIAPEHSSHCVREQLSLVPSPYKSVREQVKHNTAPEHQYFAPEQTHWVEKYWVKRGNKKYDYFRYCWMEGRKIRRIHIGSVDSHRAKEKKEAVELAISEGESPDEIKQLIKCFETRQT
ncbi:hypothetical protein CEN50_22800 [Fischerella thermalis CCMEE 5268]|uniref:AP2 domain-containing protein n=1 Tax=Fischerella thermalis CCMEE 5268 TaxID=2019662 RepID=A0A2N6KAI0_9CYAN|nr:hypothetical protein [Fischerella thermalis]PLZ95289.1 hypothetical protein CEN50_22800 [Fischerella thermalis CCMEE 5268]